MLTIRAMSGGAGYAARHLEHSDYYDEHRRVQGEWTGRGAELLGLRGEVTQEHFEAIREGLHPETGEFLRPRHSVERAKSDGSEQSKGRSLYDLTFSAPKSVSIQALVGGDDRLVAAHDEAVREALAEAESHAAARVRLNGSNEDRTTASWIVAAYRHDTSRELDPQLHTHAVAANLTYDGVEGRWKALQASGLYERRSYLTEVYRNALAREVRGLGYEIEPRRDFKGRDHGFEIRGVSNELLERYSVRSAPMTFAACTGVRRGEMLSLRWMDVDMKNRRLYLRETKNGALRILPIPESALTVLRSLPQGSAGDSVFAGVDPAHLSVYAKRVFKRLGILDASFHTLRHTAASWLVQQGVDLYAVGQILGQETPRMTQRYAHLSPDYMAGAVGKLDGIMGGMLGQDVPGELHLVTTESPAKGLNAA